MSRPGCIFAGGEGYQCPTSGANCTVCRGLYTPEQVARDMQADAAQIVSLRKYIAERWPEQ